MNHLAGCLCLILFQRRHSDSRLFRVSTVNSPLKERWGLGYWETNQRYFMENALELLDQPGEWYLNRETGVLTYWPLPGERLGETEVIAPRLTEFVRFAGDADKGEFVRHVTLRGLTFHHADWVLDPKGNSSTQAAVEVPATITADGALDCAVEGCEVAHVGTYGIWFTQESAWAGTGVSNRTARPTT